MNHFEQYFSTKDNLILYFQGWEAEIDPKGVVCLVHGLGEHSSRYSHVAAALNKAGYTLAAFDLRGHGKSQGQRGHSPSIDHFIDDIDDFIHQVSEKYHNLPYFLYGHSLGGLLTLNYCISCKPALPGMVISAPGLRSSLQDQKIKVMLSKYGGIILPQLKLKSGLDPRFLSHDLEVVKAYIEDPLVHDDVTLGLARSMLEGISRVFSHAAEIKIPMLVMHGREDQLVFPSGSQELCNLLKGESTLQLWDGSFHEIHNEPGKEEVFKFKINWLDRHLR